MKVTGWVGAHDHDWTPWYPAKNPSMMTEMGWARRCAKCTMRQWRAHIPDEPIDPPRAA